MLLSKKCEISPRADRNFIILSVSDLNPVGHTLLAYIERCCSTLSEFHGGVPELMPKFGAVGLGGWCFGGVFFLGGGGGEGWVASVVRVRASGSEMSCVGLGGGGGGGCRAFCVLSLIFSCMYTNKVFFQSLFAC